MIIFHARINLGCIKFNTKQLYHVTWPVTNLKHKWQWAKIMPKNNVEIINFNYIWQGIKLTSKNSFWWSTWQAYTIIIYSF
jgi:hypothetical protein